jgi:hypothetical protein
MHMGPFEAHIMTHVWNVGDMAIFQKGTFMVVGVYDRHLGPWLNGIDLQRKSLLMRLLGAILPCIPPRKFFRDKVSGSAWVRIKCTREHSWLNTARPRVGESYREGAAHTLPDHHERASLLGDRDKPLEEYVAPMIKPHVTMHDTSLVRMLCFSLCDVVWL